MSTIRGNESTFELATIQRLQLLGYEYVYGPEVEYKGGQRPIIHLEADLREVAAWADKNEVR